MSDPAQASRFVRNALRLKRFFAVAGIDECSHCDVLVGPAGSCTTPRASHGETASVVTRSPSRRKSNAFGQPRLPATRSHGASGAGTPSLGGTTWS